MSVGSTRGVHIVLNRLLASLSDEERGRLVSKLEAVPLVLHDVLISAQEPIEHVYFPLNGLVSTIAEKDEHRIEVGLIGREGLVGTAVILGTDRSAHSCVVQSDGEAVRIRAADLRAAIAEHPALFRPLGLYVQAYIAQMAQTIYANAGFTIEARLARWILMAHDRIDGDELHLTHDFLSIMLGVRRPGVTAASHVLEGKRLIRNTRGCITVHDRAGLVELAGGAYQVAEDEYERLLTDA